MESLFIDDKWAPLRSACRILAPCVQPADRVRSGDCRCLPARDHGASQPTTGTSCACW